MNINVLVVDDEKPLRDFVRRNLEVRGYKVLTASNGLEALAIFRNENVQLVILDIMMPHMDGLEATRRIRQESHVPIIILTAFTTVGYAGIPGWSKYTHVAVSTHVNDGAGLKCAECRRVYPIKDDIPIMLADEATVEP